jgi:type IV pilus assembly protein PilN
MLRINLLPIRQLKKRAKARNQIISAIVALCCLLLLLGLFGIWQKGKINAIQAQIAELTKQKDAFAPILADIAKIKKQKEELERKTAVINKLRSESSLTVRVLDEVAKSVDNSRLWLDSLDQSGATLNLTGVALDNETVAQFMDRLKTSPFVVDVNLTSSSLKIVSGKNLKSFVMNCSISQPKKEETSVTKK